jgi:hypothetical protein
MDQLYRIAETEDDQVRRLKLSYGVLNSHARFSAFRPCIKEYIKTHMMSRFFWISPKEWDLALFLPTARFIGASEDQVWIDSRKIIRKRR